MTGSLFDKAFQRGVEQGIERGIEQGEAKTTTRLLERRLNRLLSLDEQRAIAMEFASGDVDALLSLVLDGQPQELEAWLRRVTTAGNE